MENNISKQSKYTYPTKSSYLTANGEVTEPIVKLLGLTGIRVKNDSIQVEPEWPEPKIYLKSRALVEIVAVTQGKLDPSLSWLGDLKKERWEDDPKK